MYILLYQMSIILVGGDKRRKEELYDCTKILGIPEANVTIVM